MDNIPIITNSNINLYQGEHWLYNKKWLKDSCIQSIADYNNNFVHLDNFTGESLCKADLTAVNGLELSTMRQYSFILNGTITGSTPTVNLYVVFICQKTLFLGPAGVQVA